MPIELIFARQERPAGTSTLDAVRAQSGARVVQLDGGNMQMLGGSISGVGGSAEVRLSDAVLSLIGTNETASTGTLIGSSAIRRVSFS